MGAPTTVRLTGFGALLGYAYPVLFPTGGFEGVTAADPRDIACMKITAIASRGTKRDFVDLYQCARQFGLQELLGLFTRKYAETRYSTGSSEPGSV